MRSILALAVSLACLAVPVQAQAARFDSLVEDESLTCFVEPPAEKRGPEWEWKARADREARIAGIALRAAPEGAGAAEEAGPHGTKTRCAEISKITGLDISKKNTPATHALLKASLKAVDRVEDGLKDKFKRPRPTMVYPEEATCRDEALAKMKHDRSYPSGHAASAWMTALVFGAVLPEKAGEITRAMYGAGERRWICGHHWASDVEASRNVSAVVFARLAGDPDYREMLGKARSEILNLLAKTKE